MNVSANYDWAVIIIKTSSLISTRAKKIERNIYEQVEEI